MHAPRQSSRRRPEGRRTPVPETRSPDRDANRTRGEPLGGGARSHLEPRFGHSFEQVRVHADASAAAMLEPLHAPAATLAGEIYVRPEYYAPDSPAGRYLLAHELAHVVQGRERGTDPALGVSRSGDAAERDAGAAAAAVMAGFDAPAPGAAAAAVAPFSFDPGALWNTITDNTISGGVGLATEMSKTAASPVARGLGMVDQYGREVSKVAGEASGLPMLGRLLGPLGLISNGMALDEAMNTPGAQGVGDSIAAASGMVGSLAPTLELAAMGAQGLGATSAAGGLGSAASALGPAGAVAGSFAGGYALGDHLYHHTSVGDRSQDSLGWIDDLLTGEGESSWMVRQSEEFDEAWDDGDVLGVLGNGLQIGGAATAGAIGGLAGGVADAASDAWDWMTDW